MFERFQPDARQTVILAQQEARLLDHGRIGTEHLLLALLRQPGTPAARVLIRHGLDHDHVGGVVARTAPGDAGHLDAQALETIGIDLGAIREKVEAAFGPGALDRAPRTRRGRPWHGHIPFTGRAKKVLELSLREAIHLNHKSIDSGHILLGLLRERGGLAARVIAGTGLDLETLRREVRDEPR